MKKNKRKLISLEHLENKFFGKKGTKKRDDYEKEASREIQKEKRKQKQKNKQ